MGHLSAKIKTKLVSIGREIKRKGGREEERKEGQPFDLRFWAKC
jgi:hypothetical protein